MTPFSNISIDPKANIYFDGKVASHTLGFPDGTEKTLGMIYPGEFHFATNAPELMEIISGDCEVVLDGSSERISINAENSFNVPGNSGFTITVKDCICEYVCSYLPA
jgi:uncharacterized protein YaiE (UPF0345 family)